MNPTTTVQPNMPQNRNYAGFGLRFLAYWVDFLILFLIGFMLQYLMGNNPFAIFRVQSVEELKALQASAKQSLFMVIGFAVGILYFIIFWVHYAGATPGKKLVGIQIVKDDGGKVTYSTAIVRIFGKIISALSIFIFGLGYLWIIWDKKKQAWHDKIAGTVVVKSGDQPQLALSIILTLLAMIFLFTYFTAALIKGVSLGLKKTQTKEFRESVRKERLGEIQENDTDKILSYAPSSCGLTLAVPKFTDTLDGKERKWLFEEIPLSRNNFLILDEDVYSVKEIQGVFVGFKESESRLGGASFSISYPGLNVFCGDNDNAWTLDEYKSLALTNKNFTVTAKEAVFAGEAELIPITLEGKDAKGIDTRDAAYLGVTPDKSKLLYIRIWESEPDDASNVQIKENIDIIWRNLRYRGANETEVKGVSRKNKQVKLQTNAIGAVTSLKTVTTD